MMLFWSLAVVLTVVALLFLLPPLLRHRATAPNVRVAANAAIYREQLAELAADLARGALTKEEFERANREIEHRIVSEYGKPAAPQPAGWRPNTAAALVVGLLLPLLVALVYWQSGNLEALRGSDGDTAHPVTRDQMESLVERLAARMEQTPEDAEGWTLLGRSLGVLGRHERAAQAYARAAQLSPKDAGLLADYADMLAVSRGRRLEGEPFAIVKRALEIDPEHIKALALAGSAEFDRRDYAAAIGYWERILKVAPPQSDFARSVTGSIAEARMLAGGELAQKGVDTAEVKQAAKGNLSLQGIVSIDPALAARLSPDSTVFVLARPVDGPRMPLAVARTTVAALPYRFTLDDSMAMAPGATISSHRKVVIAARISKSGNAQSQKGDIEGSSDPVAPGARGVKVVLSRIVD